MPLPIRVQVSPLPAIAVVAIVAGVAGAAEVRIRERASVSGDVIRLRDVAHVADRNPAARSRLENVVLGPAPAAGEDVRITYADVRNRIQTAGIDLSRIDFRGSAAVRVRRSDRSAVAPAGLEFQRPEEFRRRDRRAERAERLASKAISRHVEQHAPELGGVNVTADLPAGEVDGVLSARNGAYAVRSEHRLHAGSQVLQLLYQDRRGTVHRVDVRCTITRKPYVVAARGRIDRGQLIQAADVELVQSDAGTPGFTNLKQVVGSEAVRMIARGAPLKKRDVRRRPLVRANAMVTVCVRIGSLNVSRTMLARSAGALGETITLSDPGSRRRKLVSATVTGPNEAEIAPSRRVQTSTFRDDTGLIVFRDQRRSRLSAKPRAVPPNRNSRSKAADNIEDRFRPVSGSAGRVPSHDPFP